MFHNNADFVFIFTNESFYNETNTVLCMFGDCELLSEIKYHSIDEFDIDIFLHGIEV